MSKNKVDAENGLPVLPELPPLELPPLDLPPIPELDLSFLDEAANQPPPPRRQIQYGSQQPGAGPISFEQMLKLKPPPEALSALPSFDMPTLKPTELARPILSPSAPVKAEEPTLAPAPAVQPVPDVKPEHFIETKTVATPEPRPGQVARPQETPLRKMPLPATKPERPQVTPLVSMPPPPMAPLKERVIEFEEEEATPIRPATKILVNLRDGYIENEKIEQPLDAGLQMALLKLKEFLGQEFDLGRLQQMRQQVRGLAAAEKPTGELLKAVITPVLKLGARRYAVINELLLLKEQLPLMEHSVAAALLEEILSA